MSCPQRRQNGESVDRQTCTIYIHSSIHPFIRPYAGEKKNHFCTTTSQKRETHLDYVHQQLVTLLTKRLRVHFFLMAGLGTYVTF